MFQETYLWKSAVSLPCRAVAVLAFVLLGFGQPALAEEPAPVIAAASNMEFALSEIAGQFHADTGFDLRLSFGSTGNLSRQIREGAPYELFLAADEKTPLALQAEGLTQGAGRVYAVGRIVLVAPKGGMLVPDAALDGLAALVAAGGLGRFAIANPDHAPFGVAAREALQHRGLWEAIEPKLVLGENIAQAAQFALSGNAEGGIIALSLALAPNVAAQGDHALIPEDWHSPLTQRMVLLQGAGPVAQEFYDYLQSPPARATLERYGFGLPQE